MPKNDLPIRHPDAPLEPTEEELRAWRIPPQFQKSWEQPGTTPRNNPKSLYRKALTIPTPTPSASIRGTGGTGNRVGTDREEIIQEFGVRTLDIWMENEELLKEAEQIARLGRRGELTQLVAREKMGKTTAAASDLVRAAEAGYSVLWLSYEEGRRRVISRLANMVTAVELEEIKPLVFVPEILPRKNIILDNGLSEVARLIKAMQCDYVILDSASSFVEAIVAEMPDHSEGEKWQAIFNRLREIACDVNCAFLVLVHATKGDHMEARGSTGITAAADRIFYMDDRASKKKPQPRLKPFRGIKEVGRSGLREFTLGFDPATGMYYDIDEDGSDDARDSREDQVAYWVAMHPEMSDNAIYKEVGGRREDTIELIKQERERNNGS